MFAPRLALALLLVCGAAPLAACDLDGLPGFHRANPFARAPMFRGVPAAQPPSAPQDDQRAARPQQDRAQPATASEPRSWERTDNPGPISPEDKAVFH
ncbi:MAG: hypothetical protein ACJLS3_08320 [Erythrobacter sp.]